MHTQGCHYFETETLKTILSSQIPIKKHSPGDKILFVKNYTERDGHAFFKFFLRSSYHVPYEIDSDMLIC